METKTYFIESKEQYLAIKASWSKFANSNATIYPEHLILYNILRSKNPLRGFVPATNLTKLANGHDKWFGTKQALYSFGRCKYGKKYIEHLKEPFGETINEEDILRAWEQIKDLAGNLR